MRDSEEDRRTTDVEVFDKYLAMFDVKGGVASIHVLSTCASVKSFEVVLNEEEGCIIYSRANLQSDSMNFSFNLTSPIKPLMIWRCEVQSVSAFVYDIVSKL